MRTSVQDTISEVARQSTAHDTKAAASASPDGDPLSDPVGFGTHDHGRCIATAMAQAEARCTEEGLRLTPARRRVLEILLEEHRAMGAYDVLERMQKEGLGAQPPAAYRALDFLVVHGFAHRIEGLNAFVACVHPGSDHLPAFLHCRDCGTVAEAVLRAGSHLLSGTEAATGFHVERVTVEAKGLCQACARTAAERDRVAEMPGPA